MKLRHNNGPVLKFTTQLIPHKQVSTQHTQKLYVRSKLHNSPSRLKLLDNLVADILGDGNHCSSLHDHLIKMQKPKNEIQGAYHDGLTSVTVLGIDHESDPITFHSQNALAHSLSRVFR